MLVKTFLHPNVPCVQLKALDASLLCYYWLSTVDLSSV